MVIDRSSRLERLRSGWFWQRLFKVVSFISSLISSRLEEISIAKRKQLAATFGDKTLNAGLREKERGLGSIVREAEGRQVKIEPKGERGCSGRGKKKQIAYSRKYPRKNSVIYIRFPRCIFTFQRFELLAWQIVQKPGRAKWFLEITFGRVVRFFADPRYAQLARTFPREKRKMKPRGQPVPSLLHLSQRAGRGELLLFFLLSWLCAHARRTPFHKRFTFRDRSGGKWWSWKGSEISFDGIRLDGESLWACERLLRYCFRIICEFRRIRFGTGEGLGWMENCKVDGCGSARYRCA